MQDVSCNSSAPGIDEHCTPEQYRQREANETPGWRDLAVFRRRKTSYSQRGTVPDSESRGYEGVCNGGSIVGNAAEQDLYTVSDETDDIRR